MVCPRKCARRQEVHRDFFQPTTQEARFEDKILGFTIDRFWLVAIRLQYLIPWVPCISTYVYDVYQAGRKYKGDLVLIFLRQLSLHFRPELWLLSLCGLILVWRPKKRPTAACLLLPNQSWTRSVQQAVKHVHQYTRHDHQGGD